MQNFGLGGGHTVKFSLALLGALLCGCSGNSSGDKPDGSDVCDQAKAFGPVDPTALLDDMEDGNGLIAVAGTRSGSWWLSTDGTAGTTTPAADAAPTPERILGGRCGSKLAIRVTGQGFTDWGAVLAAGMAYTTKEESVDLSSFKGLRFWARVGEQNSSGIRVQFQDAQTHPEGGQCTDADGGSGACYNGFGTALPVSTEWKLFELNFSRMAQRDFGHLADALDSAHIYDVEFSFEPNSVFDLWVDDLWFFE
jgi:hypothetical protein